MGYIEIRDCHQYNKQLTHNVHINTGSNITDHAHYQFNKQLTHNIHINTSSNITDHAQHTHTHCTDWYLFQHVPITMCISHHLHHHHNNEHHQLQQWAFTNENNQSQRWLQLITAAYLSSPPVPHQPSTSPIILTTHQAQQRPPSEQPTHFCSLMWSSLHTQK